MSDKATILMIEDDEDTASAMQVVLEARDYQVLLADNPADGLQMAKDKKPDLIILDVMFGERDKTEGFDYALKLKRDKDLAPIPILMVTSVNIRRPGYKFSPDTDGEYLPVDDFIDKPAKPENLVQKVEKLLEQKVSKWANWPNPEA